jgi:hypothetical protein
MDWGFYTNVSLKLDFSSRKKGAWPSRPCRDRSIMPAFIEPQTARRRSQAGRLCSFPKIQKQAAFGIRTLLPPENLSPKTHCDINCGIKKYIKWYFLIPLFTFM